MPTYEISEHGTSHSLYHAPDVAPFAKNTIILSRRGTLELRVHWFLSHQSFKDLHHVQVELFLALKNQSRSRPRSE